MKNGELTPVDTDDSSNTEVSGTGERNQRHVPSYFQKLRWMLVISITIVIAIISYYLLMYLNERNANKTFHQTLNTIADSGIKTVMLSEIARFDWEIVCSNHPYDGILHLSKYNKNYIAPSNTAHDGIWVFVFISKDGYPIYISSISGNSRVKILDGNKRCYAKNVAAIKLISNNPVVKYQLVELQP